MHDPHEAAEEARRAITNFNFVGIILIDFQHTDANGQTRMRFYDQPEYDIFWKLVVKN